MARILFSVIEVEKLRALESGSELVSRQLRRSLVKYFPEQAPETTKKTGLFGRVLPSVLRKVGGQTEAVRPLPSDASALIEGRTLPRSRHRAAWSLLSAWVMDQAYQTSILETDEMALAVADEALRANRVPSLITLLTPRYLGVRLPDSSKRRTGWASYAETQRAISVIMSCCEQSDLLNQIHESLEELPLARGRALVSSLPTTRGKL